MIKIFAGVRVGGVQAAPWQCAGAGPVLLGGEVSWLSSADSGPDSRHRVEIVVRLLDFHLQLHADNIKPVTLGGNTTAIWIFSMRANTMNRANNVPFLRLDEWCSGLWLNNISPAFLILATMQQWPVPCQCAILPILKGISFLPTSKEAQ